MSAAFDCVDHIILVRRLNVSFGIDENALKWIVSYITSRRQYVRYNGRTSEISVVLMRRTSRLGARAVVHISSFLQQMSSVSLTSTASPFMDMPMTCRSTTTVSSTTCTTSHPGSSTASVVSGSGWRTQAQRVENRIHLVWFGSSSDQMYVRVDRDQRVLHSSIQDSPQLRSRPWSVFESFISRHQADKYIVLSHTSAAYDPSNVHQWCMPRSRQGPRSFETGLMQWAPCQSTGLSSGLTVRCDACCCQTHPPATSKKSRFWHHPSPAPVAWHLGACSFQTMRSRASLHSRVGSFIPV